VYRLVKHLSPLALVTLLFVTVLAGLPSAAGASPSTAADPSPVAAEPLPVPSLSLSAAPSTIVCGAVTTMTVQIGVPGAQVNVGRELAGESAFTPIGTLTADAAGHATWKAKPARNATYRVDYAGDGTVWAPASAETTVNVRPAITLTLSTPRLTHRHDPVTVKVLVAPAHAGSTVELQIWSAAAGTWGDLLSMTLGRDSRASGVVRLEIGVQKLRVVTAADADHIAGRSIVHSLRILDPRNLYGIPTAPAHFIVVDLSQYRLYYCEHGNVVRVFRCVLGRPSLPTPKGHFRIYAKDAHMSGPYGPRRMRYRGLYAIHGTDEPWLLSRYPRNYSHGCTRLSNTNIVWLFAHCRVGTPVWNVP
jgi:hypothetical protein